MYRERKKQIATTNRTRPVVLNPYKPNSKKLKQGFRYIGNRKILHVETKQVVVIPVN